MTAEPEQIIQVQSWLGVLGGVCVPALCGAFMQYLRFRSQRDHRNAVLSMANNPIALAELAKMIPPAGVGIGPMVCLIIGMAMGIISLVSPVVASASLSPRNRCRPSCTSQQRCLNNVCTDVARPGQEPEQPEAEPETAEVHPYREPSSVNMHSTLAHMDPADLWLARRRPEDEQ